MAGNAAAESLMAANGLFDLGGVLGQGLEGLIDSTNFNEMLTAQRQAMAAATRAINASKIAEQNSALAVNITQQAVQRARALAQMQEQGVGSLWSANAPKSHTKMGTNRSPFLN